MTPIPIVYRGSADAAVQFSWFEFASNVGYTRFYGAGEKNSTAYFLSPQQFDADKPLTYDDIDIDFDYTFTKTMTVAAADAYFNCSILVIDGTNYTVTVTVYHYDGATETQIGQKASVQRAPAGQNESYRECLIIPLSEKKFIPGDILRVNITSGTVHASSAIYHDSSGGATITDVYSRTIPYSLYIDIPFNVSL